MFDINAVGYHQPRQAGDMRCMAFGAGVGMLVIYPPSFDRLVDPVHAFPRFCLIRTSSQIALRMAAQTEAGELTVVLSDPRPAKSALIGIDERRRSGPPVLTASAAQGSVNCHIFLIRRGQPCPLEERYGICLLRSQRRADTMGVMAGCAEAIYGIAGCIGQ